MLEILLLMLATSVQSVAALDGPSGSASLTPAVEAPAVTAPATPPVAAAPAVPQVVIPAAPSPEPQQLADEETPETPAPVPAPAQQTSALGLPVFPPATAPAAPTQALPSFPAPSAPVIAMPQPAPQPSTPVIIAPQPQTPPPSNQLAFLAPKTTAPASPGLVAEPQIPTGRFLTALEVRPILNATKGNWIAVREYAGKDLLYVTHLWSWRCGLLELKIGLNGAPPEPWPLPPCHPDQAQAAAILEGDGNPYREFALRSVQLIEVVLTYDDLTTDKVRFNRGGVVIP